jgi:hypothetical protein
MRFHSPQNPPSGTQRIVKEFLWLPIKLGRETRWLETAYWREIFSDDQWNPIDWIHPKEIHHLGQSFPIVLPAVPPRRSLVAEAEALLAEIGTPTRAPATIQFPVAAVTKGSP